MGCKVLSFTEMEIVIREQVQMLGVNMTSSVFGMWNTRFLCGVPFCWDLIEKSDTI